MTVPLFYAGKQHDLVDTYGSGTVRQLETLSKYSTMISHLGVMRDGQQGYVVPIGGVVVSDEWLLPVATGFDIGCGNWVGKTTLHVDDFVGKRKNTRLFDLSNEIRSLVTIGLGETHTKYVDHPILPNVEDTLHAYGINLPDNIIYEQFGTVGSGNHYVDLMAGVDGYLWIALHFGSRKVGYTIAEHFMLAADQRGDVFAEPAFIHSATPIGRSFISLMEMAGLYATMARDVVGRDIVERISGNHPATVVHNHHNFIWREIHFGREYFVMRKGATPVNPGQSAFIGGSMGTDSVIVTPKDDVNSVMANNALFRSAPHGAGRVIGRMQAKGVFDKSGNVKRQPLVTQDMMSNATQGVIVFGGDVDEAPQCYRNLIVDVLPHYQHLQVLELLSPLAVIMA